MRLLNQLRDRGVTLRLVDGDKIAATGLDALDPVTLETVRASRDTILVELRKESEDLSEMILGCQAVAERFPEEAKAVGSMLRRWQEGETIDRLAAFTMVRGFFVKVAGREWLDGAALDALVRETFPSRRVALPPSAPLAADAFAPELPRQEAMAL